MARRTSPVETANHGAVGAGGVATTGPRLNPAGVPLARCHDGFVAEMFSRQ